MTTLSRAERLSEWRRWMRAHPYAVDGLLAAGTFVMVLLGAATDPLGPQGRPHFGGRDVTWPTILLAALACAALAARRRAPLTVLCLTSVVSVGGLALDPHSDALSDPRTPIAAAAVIALYTASNRTDRATSWRIGAATVGILTAAGMLFGASPWYAQENLAILAWTALAAAVGEAVRARQAAVGAIRERAERAERTREEEALRRVAEERMRIARELHDVVAHHIALVNVQAGVASHVMDQRPDQAKTALAHVREASRHALDELQGTVGLLRQSGDPAAPTEPAPGLDALTDLITGFEQAGLSIDVQTPAPEPGAAPLPSALDLTAYRVVQEALTNVQKHVGPGAHVTVTVTRDRHHLVVTVTDDGAGDFDAATDTGGGHGLTGMRERTAALHGRCETGPREEGGFRVHVILPFRAAPDTAKEPSP